MAPAKVDDATANAEDATKLVDGKTTSVPSEADGPQPVLGQDVAVTADQAEAFAAAADKEGAS